MDVPNHQDIVVQENTIHPPEKTVDGALAFTVRVLNRLPRAERAGLLRKPAGENIAAFHGVLVSAARICYPDGTLRKILTDVPATMAPVWNDDGTVDPALYFDVAPFLDPEAPPAPKPPAPPEPPAPQPSDDEHLNDAIDLLLAAGDRIVVALQDVRGAVEQLGARLDQLNHNADDIKAHGVPIHLGR